MLNGDAGIGFSLWKYRRSESQGFTASVTLLPPASTTREFCTRVISTEGVHKGAMDVRCVISTEGALSRRPMTYGTFQQGVNRGAIDVRS